MCFIGSPDTANETETKESDDFPVDFTGVDEFLHLGEMASGGTVFR